MGASTISRHRESTSSRALMSLSFSVTGPCSDLSSGKAKRMRWTSTRIGARLGAAGALDEADDLHGHELRGHDHLDAAEALRQRESIGLTDVERPRRLRARPRNTPAGCIAVGVPPPCPAALTPRPRTPPPRTRSPSPGSPPPHPHSRSPHPALPSPAPRRRKGSEMSRREPRAGAGGPKPALRTGAAGIARVTCNSPVWHANIHLS